MSQPMDVTHAGTFGRQADLPSLDASATQRRVGEPPTGSSPAQQLQTDRPWSRGPDGSWGAGGAAGLAMPQVGTGAAAGQTMGVHRGPMVMLMTLMKVTIPSSTDSFRRRDKGMAPAGRRVAEHLSESDDDPPMHEASSGGMSARGGRGIALNPLRRRVLQPAFRFSPGPVRKRLPEAESRQMAFNLVAQLQEDFRLSKAQAAGIAGSLYHSSSGMNTDLGLPDAELAHVGCGWARWTGDRKEAFIQFSRRGGLDRYSPAANYAYLEHELRTTEWATVDAVRRTRTPAQAAVVFRRMFERATHAEDRSRIALANMLHDSIT
jgi:hypothetical protein